MTATIIQTDGNAIVMDLSMGAKLCGQAISGLGVAGLATLINRAMSVAGTNFAFGRWAEPRGFYSNKDFSINGSDEMRTIHLGLDIFCASGTPVYSPLEATVVEIGNNQRELDYGPVVILEHDVGSNNFYTLYGHLSLDTFNKVTLGQVIHAGEQISSVGEPPMNGNWPPHLHFQVINDLLGLGVNFPGVASKSEQKYWLDLSPSPAGFFPEIAAELLVYK
ncbi:uncharacterized protein METZ01_LOCUS262209 [marine metagenome]|uniref:M23ase beta-sheet core domain-containing protein n=1 Tax=marine metagenome TaxID=408172 RepID=A0A382JCP0_9ZZZZ